ncbi:MAG: hypothetical protein RL077_1003 [Verrucomicrobiota bacterium]|jgi:hypothetical protein
MICAFFWLSGGTGLAVRAVTAELVEQTKMGDAGAPGAFTDLIHWRGQWWCTFREAEAHGGGDGRIRVIVSREDGAHLNGSPSAHIN